MFIVQFLLILITDYWDKKLKKKKKKILREIIYSLLRSWSFWCGVINWKEMVKYATSKSYILWMANFIFLSVIGNVCLSSCAHAWMNMCVFGLIVCTTTTHKILNKTKTNTRVQTIYISILIYWYLNILRNIHM